jgi:hypothetical protein
MFSTTIHPKQAPEWETSKGVSRAERAKLAQRFEKGWEKRKNLASGGVGRRNEQRSAEGRSELGEKAQRLV